MISQGNPSVEALRIIAESTFTDVDRSPENLPKLREETRAFIAPAVERVLRSTNVSTHETIVAGVKCLEVLPPERSADWRILYGFGGGFVQGSPFEDLTIAAPLCAMTGARVIIPEYRLAPEHPWPAAIDDGFAVYEAMAGTKFALVGESAGGNWALSLILRAMDERLALPGAAALLSPWCDLTNSGDSQVFNDGRDPSLTTKGSIEAAAPYSGGNALNDPKISPINGTFDATFPPCIITTGTRDLLMSQAARLSTVLKSRGAHIDLRVWDGLWHVFEWDDRLPEAQHSLKEIANFLSE